MEDNSKRLRGSRPEDGQEREEYLGSNLQEEDLPWHTARTDHIRSRSKAKARNKRRRSETDMLGDEFLGDSDLE